MVLVTLSSDYDVTPSSPVPDILGFGDCGVGKHLLDLETFQFKFHTFDPKESTEPLLLEEYREDRENIMHDLEDDCEHLNQHNSILFESLPWKNHVEAAKHKGMSCEMNGVEALRTIPPALPWKHDVEVATCEEGKLMSYKMNGVETLRTIPPAYFLNQYCKKEVEEEEAEEEVEDNAVTVPESEVVNEFLKDCEEEEENDIEPAEGCETWRAEDVIKATLACRRLNKHRDVPTSHRDSSVPPTPSLTSSGSTRSSRSPSPDLPSTVYSAREVKGSSTPQEELTDQNTASLFTPDCMSTSFADSDISMTEDIDLPVTSPPQNSTYDNWSLPVIQGAAYIKPQSTLPPQDHLPQNPFLAFDVNPSPGQASSSSSPLFVQGPSRDHALDSTSAYVPNLDYKPPSKSRKRKAEFNDTPSNPSSSKRRRCGGPTVSTHGPLYCLFKGCKSFDKIFPNLKERNRHMDTHFDHRFACPACKTTFSRPESVKRHLKELTGAECKELVGTPDSDSFAIRGPYWKDIPWRTSELHIPRESDPLYALAMFGQP